MRSRRCWRKPISASVTASKAETGVVFFHTLIRSLLAQKKRSEGYLKIIPMTAVSFAVWQSGKRVLNV